VMLDGAADSLAYFSAAFGPYQHRQFRILEFPGYRSFAQSFPNTIPYSEDIGFVADLRDPADIDYVYYVTAHEAAHQWWAHQVAPAYTQGSTFIIESLAQYSALMVMEQRYGADKMRRFLKYELDRYLRGRGGEAIEELPLNRVENQAYIHYQKGGIALYDLKMLIGEAALNRALRGFVSAFGSKDGVFPTSTDLIAALRAEAPAEAQDRITDLFEKITIYDLKLADVALTPTAAGYEVTLDIEAHKFYADGEGRETEAPLAEVITLGLFPEPSQARSAELHRNDLPEPLLLTEQLIRSGRQTVTLTVAERPARAGVDPYVYRIDRNPDDNLKRVP
ncbi:MAG: M1 family aminopeptidase, partial [Pseudomonadota bacterium]